MEDHGVASRYPNGVMTVFKSRRKAATGTGYRGSQKRCFKIEINNKTAKPSKAELAEMAE
jgi:hypothetical protein